MSRCGEPGAGAAGKTPTGGVYRPRNPRASPLYQCADRHLADLRSEGRLQRLLEVPTSLKADGSRSFYGKVTARLILLPPWESNRYGWLRIMFDFCRNKPFAYCSRYRPGPRVHAIAREFGVRIIHVPLQRIPRRMLDRHQSFEFMCLTRSQYEDLLERIAESKSAWIAAES